MEWMHGLIGTFGTLFDWIREAVANHPIPAAAITLLSVASAVWTNHKNRAATIFGHSMQAITHLDQRWEAQDMRDYRRMAATYLLRQNSSKGKDAAIPSVTERESLRAILNFLETVGVFVRMKALDRRTAWQLFGSAAQLYVEAASQDLAKYRDPHTTVYTEMKYLYSISRIEEQRINLPCAWLWTRLTALKLTFGGRARKGRFLPARLASGWNVVTAAFTGNVAEFHDLPPLFPDDQIFQYLQYDSNLWKAESRTTTSEEMVAST
jgi:hypothetical protein